MDISDIPYFHWAIAVVAFLGIVVTFALIKNWLNKNEDPYSDEAKSKRAAKRGS